MDQFATGLVGTPPLRRAGKSVQRGIMFPAVPAPVPSPSHGAQCLRARNGYGGGLRRVPAGFNNIVGWKPTRGAREQPRGRSRVQDARLRLRFALTVDDADTIGNIIGEFDSKTLQP